MASVNSDLLDSQIAHAVSLLKYGSHLSKEIIDLLETIVAELSDTLAARLVAIKTNGYDTGSATTARITAMIDEITPLIAGVYAKTYDKLKTDLTELSKHEAEWQAASLNNALTINYTALAPSPTLLEALVTESPMNGYLLKPFVDGMEAGTIARIDQAVRVGVATGSGVEEIVRSIRGTRAAGYRDGVYQKSRDSARSIVRTAVTHVTNQAAQLTYQRNSDLIGSYQWVSVLDNRTTITCASLDGKVFPLGEGPVPPAHIRCRSTTIPITKSFADLGLDRGEYDEGTRASMDGQVPARTTFDSWLKNQSQSRQVDVLGATRQKLFTEGKLDLSDFVKGNHQPLTLDELKAKHPSAF